MRRGTLLLLVPAALLAGCGGTTTPSARATVTATVTVTATATASATSSAENLTGPTAGPPPAEPAPPRLRLTVFEDGCGVIRSEGAPGEQQNLTWVFRDSDGFQVLGRNAEGETRYRYFQGGTYTVVLEAFGPGHYVPVSNTVTVHC